MSSSPGYPYSGPGDVAPPVPAGPGPRTPGPGAVPGPATPGPAAPGVPSLTPGTKGPATGGPAGPRTPGPAAPAMRSGKNRVPIVFTHGRTVRERLDIDWDYPVVPLDRSAGQTRAPYRVLPRDEAFAFVAGNDRRPLLVLRECTACRGTDDALLSRKLDNDRTLLLSHWFHCVKLPAHVLDTNHSLHNLFRHESWEGEKLPHLILCDPTGTQVVPFDGGQSQSELWKAMAAMLAKNYEGDPQHVVRELLGLYPQIDRVDQQLEQVALSIDGELEEKGASTPRLGKLQAKYAALVEEKKQLLAREAELRKLPMR